MFVYYFVNVYFISSSNVCFYGCSLVNYNNPVYNYFFFFLSFFLSFFLYSWDTIMVLLLVWIVFILKLSVCQYNFSKSLSHFVVSLWHLKKSFSVLVIVEDLSA